MVDIYREQTMIVTKTPSLRTKGHTHERFNIAIRRTKVVY